MRVLIQRVTKASVQVDDRVVGRIGRGFLLLTGIADDDQPADIELLATKIANLRIFEDVEEKMNLSALDLLGSDAPAEMLVVSQFTLYADARKGRRPSFVRAARPEVAVPLLNQFVQHLVRAGFTVAEGEFGADMAVHLTNDGPVTIWLDSAELQQPRS